MAYLKNAFDNKVNNQNDCEKFSKIGKFEKKQSKGQSITKIPNKNVHCIVYCALCTTL